MTSYGVPPWWRMYLESRDGWETDDFEEVLAEMEKKPPNRQLLSPVIAGYLAGLLDGGGEVGYLILLHENKKHYVPYICFRISSGLSEFVMRQVGDGLLKNERRNRLGLYVTGLRAVVLAKVVGHYLHSPKKRVLEYFIGHGYKMTVKQPETLLVGEGLKIVKKKIVLNNYRVTKLVALC